MDGPPDGRLQALQMLRHFEPFGVVGRRRQRAVPYVRGVLTTLEGGQYPVRDADARAWLVATWIAWAAYEGSARGEQIRLEL